MKLLSVSILSNGEIGYEYRSTGPTKQHYSEADTNAGNAKTMHELPTKNIQSKGFEIKNGNADNYES